jgi:hypothetical protein
MAAEYCSLEIQTMSMLLAALHSVVRDSSPAFTVDWLIHCPQLSQDWLIRMSYHEAVSYKDAI